MYLPVSVYSFMLFTCQFLNCTVSSLVGITVTVSHCLIYTLPQKEPGLNKGEQLVNTLFHWLEILMTRAWILKLVAITTYVHLLLVSLVHLFSVVMLKNRWQLFQDHTLELKATSEFSKEGSSSRTSRKNEMQKYSGSKEAISTKYAALREQSKSGSSNSPVESITSAKVSLLDPANSQPSNNSAPSGLATKWASMKQGFQNFKANIEAKKFMPLRQSQEPSHMMLSRSSSSSDNLDEIFQRLKRPAEDGVRSNDYDDDDDDHEIEPSRPNR